MGIGAAALLFASVGMIAWRCRRITRTVKGQDVVVAVSAHAISSSAASTLDELEELTPHRIRPAEEATVPSPIKMSAVDEERTYTAGSLKTPGGTIMTVGVEKL